MPCTPGWRSLLNAPVLVLAALMVWGSTAGCAARRGTGAMVSASVPADNRCLESHRSTVLLRRMVDGAAGNGRLQFVSGEGRGRVSFDYVFRRPDQLRLIFHSPLGPVAAVLEIHRDRYLFADFRAGLYLQGIPGEDDLYRLTGLPFEPQMLISLLLAEPVPGSGREERLVFDEETCLPLACEMRNPLDPRLPVTVAWRWPGDLTLWGAGGDGLDLPDRVVFSGPGPDRRTTIRFKSTRPLTASDLTVSTDEIDFSRLKQATLDRGEENHLPSWISPMTEQP